MLDQIRNRLAAEIDPAYLKTGQRFFKTPIKMHGVRTPKVHKIAKNLTPKLEDLWSSSEALFESGYQEEALIAIDWLAKFEKTYTVEDWQKLDTYLSNYITNWALCDAFCTWVLYPYLRRYPQCLPQLDKWAKDQNRWKRRASVVSLIPDPSGRGASAYDWDYIALRSAAVCLDTDDLVRKGCGWLLKNASLKYPDEVHQFVLDHSEMSSTVRNYALERLK